jgi:hypothetical protein
VSAAHESDGVEAPDASAVGPLGNLHGPLRNQAVTASRVARSALSPLPGRGEVRTERGVAAAGAVDAQPSPESLVPAASEGREDGAASRGPVLPRHAEFKWCVPCNSRARLHIRGVCQMAYTHG